MKASQVVLLLVGLLLVWVGATGRAGNLNQLIKGIK